MPTVRFKGKTFVQNHHLAAKYHQLVPGFTGDTKNNQLYMMYKPYVERLKRNAFRLDGVKAVPKFKGKQRLVFAPAKYVDDYTCLENRKFTEYKNKI